VIIERIFTEREGYASSFREIYQDKGASYFKEIETDAVERALGTENAVISLGGGTLAGNEELPLRMKDHQIIYLAVHPDLLYERILKDGLPAFFDTENSRKSFDNLYAEREPFYRELSGMVFENSSGTPFETAQKILTELEKSDGG